MITIGTAIEDSVVVLLARIVGADGEYITRADVSAIVCKVWDLADTATAAMTPSVVVANVIYDTLQTNNRWTVDAVGYNFAYPIILTEGDRTYRVELKFTTGGGVFYVLYEIDTVGIFSE